jgi:Tol biopolymer transport system component
MAGVSGFVRRHGWFGVSAVSALVCVGMVATGASGLRGVPVAASTSRVSVDSTGAQGVSASGGEFNLIVPSISADRRYVVFASDASNLVADDTNSSSDVFVRDRVAHTTRRISVSSTGGQSNGDSTAASISADGRYVAFTSWASNLVPGDTNGQADVFVRDRVTHSTRLVSVSTSGEQGNSFSFEPSISAHGRFVAFSSDAYNLVGGDNNGRYDVFVRDRASHRTRMVSVSTTGTKGSTNSGGPSISANGRYVAFWSISYNLVPGDTNLRYDVFVRDRVRHTTHRVSVSSTGRQGNHDSFEPSISADGRFVAFASLASNLIRGDTKNSWDVFVRDRVAHTTRRVTRGGQSYDGPPMTPSISADGRFVAFASDASNLVGGDTNQVSDVFVRDRVAHTTRRISVSTAGRQGNNVSLAPAISPEGRSVVFDSDASDLVSGDTNGTRDVFVRDRPTP